MVSNFSKTSSDLVRILCDRPFNNLSIYHENKNGLLNKIFNVKNEGVVFSFNNKKVSFNCRHLFSVVDNALDGQSKNKWFIEETRSLLSSEINKVIDCAGRKYGKILNENDKKKIFDKMSSGISLELDPRCTQSSISQILINNKTLLARIESLYLSSQSCDEKNKLKNLINSELTNVIFMRKFGGVDLEILRRQAAEEIAFLMKKKNTGADSSV